MNKFFLRFFQLESFAGILLLIASALAIVWANSPFHQAYELLRHAKFSLGPDNAAWSLNMPIELWVNDGLMVLFFIMVGLEIKRELVVGELANRRRAVLAAASALGGMIVPALIYTLFNAGAAGGRGWGVPMATDIAFSLAVMSLLGTRIPLGLKIFLTALAIVDDLGAVMVIAIFYTPGLNILFLLLALGLWGLALLAANRGIKNLWVYGALGLPMWYFMLRSGVHATIAGVLLSFAVPLVVGKTENERDPLHQLESLLQPWVNYLVLPLFGLVNAGVNLGSVHVGSIAVGVALGLLLGKPIGIFLASWLAVRARWAALPEGTTWAQLLGAGMLGGIGFTMSLFVSGLAFGEDLQNQAKLGILMGSFLAACAGAIWLSWVGQRKS